MNALANSLQTLPDFLLYFLSAVLLCFGFLTIYVHTTPHRELELIKTGNRAAAIKLGGVLIGFVLPLASVITHSVGILDMCLWGLVALAVQLLGYQAMRLFIPNLSEAIAADNRGVGTWAGAVAISLGLLNAACMTY
jgi:putative membrane protein